MPKAPAFVGTRSGHLSLIVFLTTAWHRRPSKALTDGTFGFNIPPCVNLRYDIFFRQTTCPLATYVFTDHERLSSWELELAETMFRFLEKQGLRCLNDPAQVRTRVELLRRLAADGISDIEVWRADEAPRPERFPVFVRGENDHSKPLSPLIHDQGALDKRLAEIRSAGRSLRGLIVLEHRPAPYGNGLWHKWGAFRVGDTISVDHLAVDKTWLVKYGDYDLLTDEIRSDEHDAVITNRYEDEVRAVFDVACVEYGRADYGFIDDRLVLYEINTNPSIGNYVPAKHPVSLEKQRHARERMARGLFAIDTPETGTIALDIKDVLFKRIRKNPGDVPFWRP